MDYLTVKEYAELKKCKTQYIQKLCKEGKIKAEQQPHPQNKKMCYMIPTSALSEELQAKYYGKLKSDLKLPEFKEDKESLKGMSRLDVWNKTRTSVRMPKTEELNLMMMRSMRCQKIKRNGVYVEIFGEKLWYMDLQQTVDNLQKKVYVRYDPADLRSVRLYDEEDRYLFTWQSADALLVDYITGIKEDIAEGEKIIRTVRKFVKEQAKGISANLTNDQRITMLDMTIRKAKQNKLEKFKIEMPSNIIPIRANEKKPEELKQAAGAEKTVIVDLDKIARNGMKRKGD